ncbi:hypothetical protein ACFFWE_28765 [Sphaerisporangium melleum]|nr:hypothetical protein [Sphaerisporangium melleum]
MTATAIEPGTPLPAIVICCAEVLGEEFDALLASVESAGQQPQPGSPYLIERKIWVAASDSQAALWSEAHLMARGILLNLFDHLAMLRKAFSGPEQLPLYAHMTLARVVMEAAVQICELVDPAAGFEQRVLRAAQLGLRSRTLEMSAVWGLPAGHQVREGALEKTVRRREEFASLVEKAGIEVRRGKDERPKGVRYLGSDRFLDLDPSMTELVGQRFPALPSGYQLTSGVVHSMEWMLRDAYADDDADAVRAEPDLLGMGMATLMALNACAAVAESYAELYGHDPESAAEASARRRRRVDEASAQEYARMQGLGATRR